MRRLPPAFCPQKKSSESVSEFPGSGHGKGRLTKCKALQTTEGFPSPTQSFRLKVSFLGLTTYISPVSECSRAGSSPV
jgi:hypothetical protein